MHLTSNKPARVLSKLVRVLSKMARVLLKLARVSASSDFRMREVANCQKR